MPTTHPLAAQRAFTLLLALAMVLGTLVPLIGPAGTRASEPTDAADETINITVDPLTEESAPPSTEQSTEPSPEGDDPAPPSTEPSPEGGVDPTADTLTEPSTEGDTPAASDEPGPALDPTADPLTGSATVEDPAVFDSPELLGELTVDSGIGILSVPVGGVVVSQVYGGGGNTGATYTHDYIELFNPGGTAVSLTGFSLQYTSATGTGNFGANSGQLTELSGTIGAGRYFLVQQASGAGNGVAPPTPDLIDPTPIAMAAGSGKVALVTGTTSLGCNGSTAQPCDAEALARIVDLVGYGTANFYEGSGAAPTLTNSTAALRGGGGCTDTNDNTADFTAATAAARNSGSPANACGVDPVDNPPTVTATDPEDDEEFVPFEANVTITFSENVNVGEGWYVIDCTESGTHSATVTPPGPATSYTLDPDSPFEEGDLCTVTIVAELVTDTDGPEDQMEEDYVFSFSVADICGKASHFIHEVQGDGTATPIAGTTVTIEGIVVGDHQGPSPNLRGFFLQEEHSDTDDDPATSEGIFVFDGNGEVPVALGDLVSATGSAAEFGGMTQLSSVANVTVCETADETDASASPVLITLPVTNVGDWERSEGMLAQFEQTMTVTENFSLGRFGELVLSSTGRQFQGTHVAAPGADAAAIADLNARTRIILDDANTSQNADPTRYPTGGLSASNTLRIGATVDDLTAVVHQGFGTYRLQPVGEITFDDAATRPASPPNVGGRIQVAAFNVLNYFNGEPAGNFADPDNRGAETEFEFLRQRTKIIEAIAAMDAEVVGLMEIENDDSRTADVSAIEDLVAGLNAKLGEGTYAFIETGTIGTDAIAVAIIYQPGEVTPRGGFAILDSTVDPRFNDERNRPVLAQSFTENATGAVFTVAVNHLKSKGSNCGGAPDDQPDSGGGNCNGTRTAAAAALADWLATDPTDSGDHDRLIIGDLNSYAMETPITTLREADYKDLMARFEGPDAYTFVFMGASGYLDHALSSPTMSSQVTDTAPWHINTDEPPVLDYNTNFKSANHINTLYAPDAFRSSDHDPVLIGLNLRFVPQPSKGPPPILPGPHSASVQ